MITIYYLTRFFECNTANCSNKLHLKDIDEVFASMKCFLLDSTTEFSFVKRKMYKIVPEWNDHVKNLYANARKKFLIWKKKLMINQ